DLDDEPALTYTAPPPQSDWDDPVPATAPEPAAPPMPAWDAVPRTREIPALTVTPTPQPEPEPEWGFDEAQIETSRRATAHAIPDGEPAAAVVAKASKPNRV